MPGSAIPPPADYHEALRRAQAGGAPFTLTEAGTDEITVVHHGPAAQRFDRARVGRLRYGAELAVLEDRLAHAIGFQRDMIEADKARTEAMFLAAVAEMRSARADMQREWRSARCAAATVSQAMQAPVRMLVLVADTSRETSTPRRRPTAAANRGSTSKGSSHPHREGLTTGPWPIGRAA